MKVKKIVCKICGKEQLEKKTLRLCGDVPWAKDYCSQACADQAPKKKEQKRRVTFVYPKNETEEV